MNMGTFIDWYNNTFILKEHQENFKKPGRVQLILDNAPLHLCEGTLKPENGKFWVKFLHLMLHI